MIFKVFYSLKPSGAGAGAGDAAGAERNIFGSATLGLRMKTATGCGI